MRKKSSRAHKKHIDAQKNNKLTNRNKIPAKNFYPPIFKIDMQKNLGDSSWARSST
jgi:hypothetical protein